MKIYVQECGWEGSILVVARDEPTAREIMENEARNYDPKRELEAFEITEGFVHINLGDS